jgi:hypothetical protein
MYDVGLGNYGHLVFFMAIWYILWSFGTFFPILVFCFKENLATLKSNAVQRDFLVVQNVERQNVEIQNADTTM